jgi:membrane protease YdiL (CAAX protease family)
MVRRIAKTQRPGMARLLLKVKELLPHTPQERRLWLLVSITAGVCEEIVFRGFLPWYFLTLGTFFGLQSSLLVALVLSSILFGFAHIYQGWKGVVGTGLLGALFAYLYVTTGSLILPIALHILADARIVFLAPTLVELSERLKVPTAD